MNLNKGKQTNMQGASTIGLLSRAHPKTSSQKSYPSKVKIPFRNQFLGQLQYILVTTVFSCTYSWSIDMMKDISMFATFWGSYQQMLCSFAPGKRRTSTPNCSEDKQTCVEQMHGLQSLHARFHPKTYGKNSLYPGYNEMFPFVLMWIFLNCSPWIPSR